MNEVKASHLFDQCYFERDEIITRIDYINFLSKVTHPSSDYLLTNMDSGLGFVYLRISDIPNIIKNAKIKINKNQYPLVCFHIMSKSLSENFSCFFFYRDFPSSIDPITILSAKDIQRAEDWEQKRRKRELLISLENLYNDNLDVFDLYDDLNDEDKLKLKLTGKLI